MSQTPPSLSAELVERYFRGECASDEHEHVLRAFAANPSLGALDDYVHAPEVDPDDLWTRFSTRMASSASSVPRKIDSTRQGVGLPHRWAVPFVSVGVAAAIVVAFVARVPQNTKPVRQWSVQTPAGAQGIASLPNGSRALLGPATTLSIAVQSSTGATTVDVVGDVTFVVAARSRVPFIVKTSNAELRVLGTEFSVRHYASDAATRVRVAEGRVSVRAHGGNRATDETGEAATVAAQMYAVVDAHGVTHVSSDGASNTYADWSTGNLVFHETPMCDVVAELGRVYDVEFQLHDSTLATLGLTWTVRTSSTPLSTALSELSAMLNVRFTRTGRVITVVPGRVSRSAARPAALSSFAPELTYGK